MPAPPDERVYFAQGVLLPWPNFAVSVLVIDTPALWVCRMQTVSVMHRLRGMEPEDSPHVQAWVGHDAALALYQSVIARELMRRGGEHSRPLHQPFWPDGTRNPDHELAFLPAHAREVQMPSWLGDPEVHSTHRDFLDERIERGGIRWM